MWQKPPASVKPANPFVPSHSINSFAGLVGRIDFSPSQYSGCHCHPGKTKMPQSLKKYKGKKQKRKKEKKCHLTTVHLHWAKAALHRQRANLSHPIQRQASQ
jgi:hypothetical protein